MIGGGEEEDRTPDLRIANATLSQLSYPPEPDSNSIIARRRDPAGQPRTTQEECPR